MNEDIRSQKSALRKMIRSRKSLYTAGELADMSATVCSALLADEHVREAETVFAYWALPDEADIRPLIRSLRHDGKTVLLPCVVSDTEMTLHVFRSEQDMSKGRFGIEEPLTPALSESQWRNLLQVSGVALIPGVAFDIFGHRLGRGRGYYDRILSRLPDVYKIGVGLSFQLLDYVPTDENDIVMNEVLCK